MFTAETEPRSTVLAVLERHRAGSDRVGLAIHEALRDAAATGRAHERATLVAAALARTALDTLTDPDLLAAARKSSRPVCPDPPRTSPWRRRHEQ